MPLLNRRKSPETKRSRRCTAANSSRILSVTSPCVCAPACVCVCLHINKTAASSSSLCFLAPALPSNRDSWRTASLLPGKNTCNLVWAAVMKCALHKAANHITRRGNLILSGGLGRASMATVFRDRGFIVG